jgi:hypothetical protein
MYLQKVISRKIAGSGSIGQRHGPADPDPYQNVTDPQHCFHRYFSHQYLTIAPILKTTNEILILKIELAP